MDLAEHRVVLLAHDDPDLLAEPAVESERQPHRAVELGGGIALPEAELRRLAQRELALGRDRERAHHARTIAPGSDNGAEARQEPTASSSGSRRISRPVPLRGVGPARLAHTGAPTPAADPQRDGGAGGDARAGLGTLIGDGAGQLHQRRAVRLGADGHQPDGRQRAVRVFDARSDDVRHPDVGRTTPFACLGDEFVGGGISRCLPRRRRLVEVAPALPGRLPRHPEPGGDLGPRHPMAARSAHRDEFGLVEQASHETHVGQRIERAVAVAVGRRRRDASRSSRVHARRPSCHAALAHAVRLP